LTTKYEYGDNVDELIARIDGTTPYWYLTDREGFLITVPSTCGNARAVKMVALALDSLRRMKVHLDDTPRNQPSHGSDFSEVSHVASCRKLPWLSPAR
jgi:hypothetical protein